MFSKYRTLIFIPFLIFLPLDSIKTKEFLISNKVDQNNKFSKKDLDRNYLSMEIRLGQK